MIFITSLRKITLNKQFIIIILIYLRVVQKVREQSCFGLFKWVLYQNGCHKIPNHIRVDLNVFHTIKLKLEWSRSRKVRMTQCENRPNFLIEFFLLEYLQFYKNMPKNHNVQLKHSYLCTSFEAVFKRVKDFWKISRHCKNTRKSDVAWPQWTVCHQ